MKILVINGVNLNMLGIREVNLYGKGNLKDLENYIIAEGQKLGAQIETFQSNYEGAICEKIQSAYNNFDGIIINAGAYTHTSIAILDALKSVNIPTVEVHLTDINNREEFRKKSYISLYAAKTICGEGWLGYINAIKFLINSNNR